jgi:DNA polymerase-1
LHHVLEDAREVVTELLHSNATIVGHNIAYDMSVIAAEWPELLPAIFDAYDADRVTDTRLRDKLQYLAVGAHNGYRQADGTFVRLGYSLAEVAERRLGLRLEKGEDTYRLRYGELRPVPLALWPAEAIAYAKGDADATHRVFVDQEVDGFLEDQFRQARAAFWLQLMRCWGVYVDPQKKAAFRARVEADVERTRRECQAAGLVRANGVKDMAAIRARVVAEFGDAAQRTEPSKTFPDGQVKFDRDVCKHATDPVLRTFAAYNHHLTELTANVPLLHNDGYPLLQPRWESLQDNGRTACGDKKEGKGNLQNLPRLNGMRECITPRPGFVFIVFDFKTFELCTWAQACLDLLDESRLASVLNDGADPHCDMAARIVGISYADAVRRYAAGDHEVSQARQAGKIADFGFPGGLGAGRLVVHARTQYDVIMTEEFAADLKEIWKEAWPEADPYFAYINTVYEGQVTQLRSGRLRAGMKFTDCANTFFSGLAADAAKASGWALAREQYTVPSSPLYGTRTVLFVHDEFVVECPEAHAHEAAVRLERVVLDAAQPWTPEVKLGGGVLLSRCWSKKAKRLVKDGKLVPWDS